MKYFTSMRRIEQISGKHISKIMNEENRYDKIADEDTGEELIQIVMRYEIMVALKHMKMGKAPGPSEVHAEMIVTSRDVGNRILTELFQRILDEKGMPVD